MPKVNGKIPFVARVREEELRYVNHGLNINIISEDDFDNMDVEVEEIN